MKKPLILVTNDDGIVAGGIRALVEAMSTLGEVVVVAPDSPQSAQGHAITISKPLRIHKSDLFPGIEAYTCTGTPVDCVKLAKSVIFKDRKPDLCVSGINHGSNAAGNILYSGTVSAAMEAAIEGIDAIAFSLLSFDADADFGVSKHFVMEITKYVLEHKLQGARLLNVNIPYLSLDKIKGIRVCKQSKARWKESFAEREDPFGRKYYWLTGEFCNEDTDPDSDIIALEEGFVSIVPSTYDLTDYQSLPGLKGLERTV